MKPIIIIPTPEQHAQARAECTDRAFNGHTVLEDGKGQYRGNIGEIVFSAYLDSVFLEHTRMGHLMTFHDFEFGNIWADTKVKGRKALSPEGCGLREVNVCTRLEHEVCHVYVFMSAIMLTEDSDATAVEIWGYIPKSEFWSHKDMFRVEVGDITAGGFQEQFKAGKLDRTHLHDIDDFVKITKNYLFDKKWSGD